MTVREKVKGILTLFELGHYNLEETTEKILGVTTTEEKWLTLSEFEKKHQHPTRDHLYNWYRSGDHKPGLFRQVGGTGNPVEINEHLYFEY